MVTSWGDMRRAETRVFRDRIVLDRTVLDHTVLELGFSRKSRVRAGHEPTLSTRRARL